MPIVSSTPERKLGPPGRIIAASKGNFRQKHPKHAVVWNANLISQKLGKFWYGDINLTTDYKILMDLSKEMNETLYILSEMDARFDTETKYKLDKSIAVITESQVISNIEHYVVDPDTMKTENNLPPVDYTIDHTEPFQVNLPESNVEQTIELDDRNNFKPVKCGDCPWSKLINFLIDNGLDTKDHTIADIFVGEDLYSFLSKGVEKWLVLEHPELGKNPYELHKHYSYMALNLSPNVRKQPMPTNNTVMIRKAKK